MAAIDPSAPVNPEAEAGAIPRATLKMIREPIQGPGDDEDDSEDEDDEDYMRALLAESDSEDDEAGASDKKSKKAAALKELMESIGQGEDESDEDMEDAPKSKKGKKAAKVDEEDSEEDSDEDSEGDMEVEEFVICTLDPTKNYQQTLDITIGEDERVFFKVDGTHDIYLTGNYLIPDDQGRNTHHEVYDSEDDEEDEDYDLSPDEDELDDMEEESDDELDTLENPRITEIEDEVPALVNKKGKNKRAAEEPAETLDEIMEKSGEKLSKKQQKKLKTNEAKAAAAPEPKESPKDAKAVKFAKNLEMGPTGSEAPKAPEKKKEALGVRLVDGIKIDDKKLGTGPGATKGDRLSMRYIGKLEDGKVFDSNKSGKPFTFTLGIKEVIQGWDTGILGMKVGGERRLTIPSKAAYGSQKLPGIPANSTLIFDIKLLDIKHKGKKN